MKRINLQLQRKMIQNQSKLKIKQIKQQTKFKKKRKVRLVKNGDPSVMTTCLIKEYINFDELSEIICESMDISKRESGQMRVFKTGGVEVFNEDVQYIKTNDILYISFGDDFDESSNFAIYKLSRCLGEGGYGRVYEAKNRISKERVAIKMLDISKIKNAKDTDMIYKELIALKNLHHKNIVKKEQKAALILEYLDGGDLREYLNEKKIIPEKQAHKLFQQLFSAIQYCHRESIIHRDLKLENIMFEDKEYDKLKVVDFGISGRQSLVCVDHTEAGSARYLSPEVIQHHYPAHPCIDVWAMGCILYWMITGNTPFPQTTREAVLDSIVQGKWSFSSQDKKKLTKAVQDLISKMLILNPQKRITMSEIAEHRWMHPFFDEMLQQEQEEEEKKKMKQQQEREEKQDDQKIDNSSVLAPLKKKSITPGSNNSLSKNQNTNSVSAFGGGNSSRNPYGIQNQRKSSTQASNSAYNSPQNNNNNNASARNLHQYSIFSAQNNNNNSNNSNNNISEQKQQDNNRLVLPKIDQKNAVRRFSYEPNSHFPSVNNFNSPRNTNSNFASGQGQNGGLSNFAQRQSIQNNSFNNNNNISQLKQNKINQIRTSSPLHQNKNNSLIIKNTNNQNNLVHDGNNIYNNSNNSNNGSVSSLNDLNIIQTYKDKNKSNLSTLSKHSLKSKE